MSELNDEVEQGGPDGGAVQGVVGEEVAYGSAGGQGSRDGGAGAVGGEAAGLLVEEALHGGSRRPTEWTP
ncbi:hypothetical protein [Streptomyces sp. NPDC048521]|uniref:hypothetical protein n=1 Tax=Streptomyces sp. NPDC048521 TaxID=3365566 RepID=UPI0037246206